MYSAYKNAFGLALLASAGAGPALRAAPAPPPTPVGLTFTLSRKSYLLREPILAECALTNLTNRDIRIPEGSLPPLYFEGSDADGDKFSLKRQWVEGTADDVPLITLRPGQSLRQWLPLEGSYDPRASCN